MSKLAIFKWAIFWKIHNFWGFWEKRSLDIRKDNYFEKIFWKKSHSIKLYILLYTHFMLWSGLHGFCSMLKGLIGATRNPAHAECPYIAEDEKWHISSEWPIWATFSYSTYYHKFEIDKNNIFQIENSGNIKIYFS